MASAAVLFGEGGEIGVGVLQIPRVGSQADFGAHFGCADAYGVDALGVQEIGNKFVVALEVEVGDIEEDDAIAGVTALAKNLDGLAVALEQGAEMLGHDGKLDHFF